VHKMKVMNSCLAKEAFLFMDKVIIVGIYEFIGFQLCLSLLEQGIEVTGIHLKTARDDLFLEEKRLEIGRNSNFTEKDGAYLLSIETWPDPTILFIDYYSYYFKREESKLSSILTTISLIKHPFRFGLLLPIQFYEENTQKELFPLLSDKERLSFVFYLPTIFGPWQPTNYAFQQALNDPTEPMIVDEREWTEDALYSEDTIAVIMSHLDDKEGEIFLLKSKIKGSWEKLVSMLVENPPTKPYREKKIVSEDVIVLEVGGIELKEGMEKQRMHLTRLKERRK
jgi:hypothetical protein